MIATSGQIPYDFEVPRMPFKICPDEQIGFSGILFEQAMWALRAERNRYVVGSADPIFHKYRHVSGIKEVIQPNPSGLNLHRKGDPAASTFIDYIIEMRNALSGLFPLIAGDSDYSTTQVDDDYFEQLYPTLEGAVVHKTFNNVILPGPGQILTAGHRLLGGSGCIYDFDLGEVLYQPYPHIAEYFQADAHNQNDPLLLDQFAIVASPLFPMFQNTGGLPVATNARDNIYAHNANAVSYVHVQSGVIRVDGDPLPTGVTLLRGEPWVSFGNYFEAGNRSIGGNLFTHLSRAFFDPTTATSGIYRIAARFDKSVFPKRGIASGIISQWPRESNYNDIGRNPSTLSHLQGYHVFDDAIWITDNGVGPFFPLTDNPPSGLAVTSPLNGDTLWVRFADRTKNTGGNNQEWPAMRGLERTGSNSLVRSEGAGVSDGAGNTTMTFTVFSNLLDKSSETTSPSFNIGPGNSISVVDMFYDGTSYFVLDSNTSGDDIYEFDSSFNFVESFEAGGLHPLQDMARNIQRAAYIKGAYYHFGTSGALHQFVMNTGAGTTNNVGNTRPIDVSAFSSIIGTVEEIQDFLDVSGGTHVNDGCWFLIRNTSDVAFLVRVEENPPDFDVVEVHRLNLPEPTVGGAYRVMTHMDIN